MRKGTVKIQALLQFRQAYQVKKRSFAPATGSKVTFIRRPPVQSSTNKITVCCPYWSCSIDKNSAFNNISRPSCALWSYRFWSFNQPIERSTEKANSEQSAHLIKTMPCVCHFSIWGLHASVRIEQYKRTLSLVWQSSSCKKESPETDQARPDGTIKPNKTLIFSSSGLETRTGTNLDKTISL